MQVPISEIVMKQRVRQDLGDLKPLMDSLEKYGQLNPIIVTRENELIAGHRRWESARRLGWYTIDAVSVDRVSEAEKLEIELEENVHRKDLEPTELLEGYTRLEKLRRPRLKQRVRNFFRGLFSRVFRRGRKRERADPSPTMTPSAVASQAEATEPDLHHEEPPVYGGVGNEDYGV